MWLETISERPGFLVDSLCSAQKWPLLLTRNRRKSKNSAKLWSLETWIFLIILCWANRVLYRKAINMSSTFTLCSSQTRHQINRASNFHHQRSRILKINTITLNQVSPITKNDNLRFPSQKKSRKINSKNNQGTFKANPNGNSSYSCVARAHSPFIKMTREERVLSTFSKNGFLLNNRCSRMAICSRSNTFKGR